jgi:EAL domain-containing protein (putative c-di-GMP-specific phosphodiesterase class I)
LEITESLLMNDAECAAATLRTLKALGGQVAIDVRHRLLQSERL